MTDITYAQVWADHVVSVGEPGETITVKVLSGDTVYYGDPNVNASTNLGSITVGSSASMTNPVSWLRSASQSFVQISGQSSSGLPTGSTAGQQLGVNSGGSFAWFDSSIKVDAWGAVGDGVTDDSAAIQAAITAAAVTGKNVELSAKTYAIQTPLVPANGVGIIGHGSSSVIKPVGAVAAFSLVRTGSTPLTDCTFSDFCIDGSAQTGGYNVATKGIFIQYLLRCVFERLKIVNTIATGLGVDFLVDCSITDCELSTNGRLWTGGQAGGADIGIGVGGTGLSTVESFSIEGCHCESSGSYGIFIEAQITTAFVAGATVTGNFCQNANKAGIGVSGAQGMAITGNSVNVCGTSGTGTGTANILVDLGTLARGSTQYTVINGNIIQNGRSHGLMVVGNASSATPRRLKITNNAVMLNGGATANQDGHGIFLNGSQHALNDFTVNDNLVALNQGSGIVLGSGTGHTNIAFRDNDVFGNGRGAGTANSGIDLLSTSVTGLQIVGNQCYAASGFQTTGINLEANATIAQAQINGNDVRGNGTNGMLASGTISTTEIRSNPGYNPVGSETVSVPATGVAVAAAANDRTYYVTAGASTCTMAIQNGPSPVIPSGAFATIRVPAGKTVTPTYTAAPTWVVEGE